MIGSNVCWRLLIFFGLPALLWTQQADSNATKYSLAGTVVNSVTGQPVRRAMVQLMAQVQREALTGSDGRFQFDNLAAGQVTLFARKPGFFSSQELTQDAFSNQPPSVVMVGASSSEARITLIPEAVLVGHIVDERGEPVEHVQVQAIADTIVNGRRLRMVRGSSASDEDGVYRIGNLQPGSYYIMTLARPEGRWSVEETERKGYAATYYPSAPDRGAAAKTELAAGQETQADFSLRLEPLFQVSGVIVGNATGRGAFLQVTDQSGDERMASNFDPQTGKFRVSMLRAGTYLIRANIFGQQPDHALSGEQEVTVRDGDLQGVQIMMGAASSIPVNVRTEFTKTTEGTSTFVNLNLESVSQNRFRGGSSIFRDPVTGVMTVKDVTPGKYRLSATENGPWYIQSAQSGEVNLLSDELVVVAGSQPQPIDIVVRDDGAVLKGVVQRDGHETMATVLLFRNGAAGTPTVLRTGAQGVFQKNSLMPGEYHALAVESVDGLEYTNPEAMRSYMSKAASVTLGENGQASVTLELAQR